MHQGFGACAGRVALNRSRKLPGSGTQTLVQLFSHPRFTCYIITAPGQTADELKRGQMEEQRILEEHCLWASCFNEPVAISF